MIAVNSARKRSRLVAAGGIFVISIAIVVAAALLLPDRTLAQVNGPDRAAPGPVQTIPPPPPPASQLNPPGATPEPGAVGASAGPPAGDSDLEAVPFRPDVALRRGDVLSISAAEEQDGTADSGTRKRPAGEVMGPQEAYQAPDIRTLLSPLDWTPLLYENFVGFSPDLDVPYPPWYGTSVWTVYDFSDDGYERSWGANDWTYYPHEDDPSDHESAWPAAAGADALDPNDYWYPKNLNSWLDYGPVDLSNMTDVFVSFGLWYKTEPENDKVYFCASIDGYDYYCDSWSGESGGWTDQAYWLTSYAGYSEVWLAWVFQSNSTPTDDDGPFVDEIWVWGDDISVTPTPTPTPDPAGELIQNGSFEDDGGSLPPWSDASYSVEGAMEDGAGQPPSLRSDATRKSNSTGAERIEGELGIASVEVTNTTSIDGDWCAFLGQPGPGDDYLYQTFDVPADITDLVLSYWFGVTTSETEFNTDLFCASLRPADLSTIWVDLGCMDATETTGYWQEAGYTLTSDEVAQVAGRTTALVFELYNRGDPNTSTAGWVDYVSAYASGGSGGSHIDPNEPNDDPSGATPINCGDTVSGVIGEAVGGYDIDWFRLSNVPAGRIDIDIDADTQVPPSALDSVVGLWDDEVNLLTWNDDDGISFDSYVVYTNTVEDATLYVSVESYWGYGSPDSFYDLTIQCADTGGGPPPPGDEPPPPDDTWTVMLYLNAEDPNFEDILEDYRRDIEAFIGSKSDFLTVTILYDGPDAGDTTRYLVQPNGSYTPGTNRWNLGELNMGQRETLENFVTWAMDQYPAENYYLAIDDHGNGVYGISWDRTSNNDQLTPPELYSALKSATHNGNRKIDIFDYEACLMGLAENAYDVREWVDYVVFSEQISWGINTYPLYFSDLAATNTPLQVGRRIVDRYHAEAMVAGGRGYPHTISLIDTSKMGDVEDALSGFGDALQDTDDKDGVEKARDSSQAFAADMDATNPWRAEYIDLWDLADEASDLAATQAAAVRSAVDAAVVHEQHASGGASGYIWDHSGAHGLSIYYPPSKSSSAFSGYASLYQMSRDGKWDEFLDWAVPSGDRRGMNASRSEVRLTGGDAFVFKYIYLPVTIRAR